MGYYIMGVVFFAFFAYGGWREYRETNPVFMKFYVALMIAISIGCAYMVFK